MAYEYTQQGMLSGRTPGQMRDLRRQQMDKRVLQAQQGHSGTARAAAEARQRGIEAIQGFRGGLFRDTEMDASVKREKDNQTLQAMFKDAESDDKITPAEYDKIIAAMSGMGYTKEAAEVQKRKIADQSVEIARIKAKNSSSSTAAKNRATSLAEAKFEWAKEHPKGTVHESLSFKKGDYHYQTLTRVDDQGNETQKIVPLMGAPKYDPNDKTPEVPVDIKGQGSSERVSEKDQIRGNDAKYEKLVNTHLYNLKNNLEGTKSKNAVLTHLKKDWNTDKAAFTNKQDDYESTLDTAEKALAILKMPNLDTTGGLSVALNQMKTWFGVDTEGITNKSQLNSFLKSMMMKKVKLLGTNPSNIDVKLTTESSADWTNSKGANIRILNDLIKTTTRQLELMDHLNSNEALTRPQFNLYKSKLRKERSAKRNGPKTKTVTINGVKTTIEVK